VALAHSHSSLAGLWWQKPKRRPFHGPPQGSPLLGVHQLREDCPLSQWRARVGCPIFSRVHHSTRNPLLRARRLPVATSAAGPRGALRVGRPAFAKSGPQPPVPKTACVGNREGRSHSGEPPAGWDARGFTPLPERACGNVGADVVGESPNGRPWTPPPQAGAWMTPRGKKPPRATPARGQNSPQLRHGCVILWGAPTGWCVYREQDVKHTCGFKLRHTTGGYGAVVVSRAWPT